jgi:hypothetical protein
MSDERTRPAGPGEESERRERVDVPVARAQSGAEGGARYSEKQVAQILQRAAQLEQGRALQKPELSLAEVEEIAREAGLDPALIRIAAQSLEGTSREEGLGARLAGAPLRRVFERLIDGELTQAVHERINGDLRAALRAEHPRRTPQLSSVGRTLTVSAQTSTGVIEIELTPRGNKTLLRIDVACGQIAGGLFGGLGGGLGVGMMPALIAGLSANAHLAPPSIALAGAAWMGTAYVLARSIFSWRAKAQYRRMEKLADQLAERIRDELAQPKS